MINYYLLTKPGIILGNLITFVAGFLLASKGAMDLTLFLSTLTGLTLIMASSAVLNNYINRHEDKKMERTKNRALAAGLISNGKALIFAACLGILGTAILLYYTNVLTVAIAGIGFFVYVVLYSFWKSRTVHGTAIGSIAGATPPIVGYTAVSGQFDLGAMTLFLMLLFWQMPHFYAIALYHFDDYAKANMPLLPHVKGIFTTKIHMLAYILSFILVSSLLTLLNYTGYVYLVTTSSIGLAWIALCLLGIKSDNNTLFGQRMFRVSLVMIVATCLIMPLDLVYR